MTTTDDDDPRPRAHYLTALTSWLLLLCPDATEYELHRGLGVLVARGRADELDVGARLDLRARTYTRVEVGDEIMRVQHGALLPDGSVLRRWEATVDSLCEIETLAGDELPVLGDRPGLARARDRVVTESGELPAVVVDVEDERRSA